MDLCRVRISMCMYFYYQFRKSYRFHEVHFFRQKIKITWLIRPNFPFLNFRFEYKYQAFYANFASLALQSGIDPFCFLNEKDPFLNLTFERKILKFWRQSRRGWVNTQTVGRDF